MCKNSLDLSDSREFIAKVVDEYETALDSGDTQACFTARDKLDRWLYPLARWYLDHSQKEVTNDGTAS